MTHPVAETFIRKWPSASRPIVVRCSDGKVYFAKGSHNQKWLVNEHVVARLGKMLDAAVCEPCFVSIPESLRAIEPELHDVSAGLSHATAQIASCSDRGGLSNLDEPLNRNRFAGLCVLYTWLHAGDHQMIYSLVEPRIVWSVDHGHFFPGGPNWTGDTLAACGPIARLEPLFDVLGLEAADYKTYVERLSELDDQKIRDVVDTPPDEWGVGGQERLALADFIVRRRRELIPILRAI